MPKEGQDRALNDKSLEHQVFKSHIKEDGSKIRLDDLTT